MPTQLAEIVFNTIADGFFPAFPANWTKFSPDTTRILNGYFLRSGATVAGARYTIPFATNEIEVSQLLHASGVSSSSEAGVQFIDSSGNGYAMLTVTSGSNFIVRCKLVVAYAYSTELFTNTFVATGNHGSPIRLRRNRTTGVMSVWLDATQLGSNFTNNTYDPTYGSVTSNASGGLVRSITLTDLSSYLVDSFNGEDDIERGQQGVAYETQGLSSVTSITSDQSGVTVSGINDTAGDGNCDLSDYAEAGLYPVLPATVIYTFGDGTNTAQITKTLAIKSTESAVVTAGLISVNSSYLGYHFEAAGRSIEDGGQIVWPTTAGLTISADGSYNYTGVVPLELSLWYITPDAGRSYEFDFTFGGGSSDDSGLTAVGLTMTGLTMTGLTMVGL